ncbi:MAG TPA: arsenate reductase (glutaredoxin) [Sandaracinaceae bacterium]
MDVVIWHNPSCSKSRQALALLKERGYEPTVRQYLKDPPTVEELRAVLKKLGAADPHALVRKKEKEYAEFGIAKLSGDAVLRALAEHPRLIERPVVITDKGARIGRPTEAILEVLE